MKVQYSKIFQKSVRKLTGKNLKAVSKAITQVKTASTLQDITNCEKLKGYRSSYRIRMGDYRALFIFTIVDNVVYFQYLLPRGEAYNKEYLKNLF